MSTPNPFEALIPFGFAEGNYERVCGDCMNVFVGDKRASVCVCCAVDRICASERREVMEARREQAEQDQEN